MKISSLLLSVRIIVCMLATLFATAILILGGPHTNTHVRRPNSCRIWLNMYGRSGRPYSVLQPSEPRDAAGRKAKRIRFFWNSVGVEGKPKLKAGVSSLSRTGEFGADMVRSRSRRTWAHGLSPLGRTGERGAGKAVISEARLSSKAPMFPART